MGPAVSAGTLAGSSGAHGPAHAVSHSTLHEHLGSEDAAPGGALQILVYSDLGRLERLIVLLVFQEENTKQ